MWCDVRRVTVYLYSGHYLGAGRRECWDAYWNEWRNAQYIRRATSSNTSPPKTAVMQAFDSSVSVKKNEGHTRGVSRPLAKATRHSSLS